MNPRLKDQHPGAPLTYFNNGGGGGGEGGGGPKDFFGSDILAKRDIWVYERRWDFFGSRKLHRDFFGHCIFDQLKSTIT